MTDPKPLGDQPAFPELHIHHWKDAVGDCSVPRWHGGLTKKEYLAGLAMQTFLSLDPLRANQLGDPMGRTYEAWIAEESCRAADALLSALAKETK